MTEVKTLSNEELIEHTIAKVNEILSFARYGKEVISEHDKKEAMDQVVGLLHKSFLYFSWTGIYLARGKDLILETFRGKPSPHQKIRIGTEGICGWAARTGESIIVPDVCQDPRYLSCSEKVKSEVVVPILNKNKVVMGVIDIDSEKLDAFCMDDVEMLEEIAANLAESLGEL